MEYENKKPAYKVGDTVYAVNSCGVERGIIGSIEKISDMIFINNIRGEMLGTNKNVFCSEDEANKKWEDMYGKIARK